MLKAILLRSKIDRKNAELKALRAKDNEFETREAELEQAIHEAEAPEVTDDDRAELDARVEQFDAERSAHNDAKTALENEIKAMTEELEAEERKTPTINNAEKREERKESHKMVNINIRALPMNQRAFDALPMEQRREIVEREDVKEFFAQLRSMKGQTRAISGGELTIPVVLLDLISENVFRYSKLMNRVRVRNINGDGRQPVAGTVPEAVWTEMCAAINELTFVFNVVNLDGFKVAGFVPVCNALLEDSDINLASWIVEMLSESIGLAKDKAILYGKGAASHMPMGIVTRLAQTSQPAGYPANAPAWTDLHSTNIIKINGDSLNGAEFWAALTVAAGNTYTKYSRGELFWAMNSKTYAYLRSKAIATSVTGEWVALIGGRLPIISGDVDILEFMPDYDIVGGYGELYLWGQRAGMTIEASREVQFIQDNTVFKGKERADGTPVIPGAFVAINVKNIDVTTTMSFAADAANDAKLTGLTVGALSLSPTFDGDTLTYTASAANNVSSAAVNAIAAEADAVIGITVTSGTTTKNVNNGGSAALAVGANTIAVTVKKGNATRVYTVTVTRAAS